MLKISCPKCKKGIYSEGFASGEKIVCPNCKKGFMLNSRIRRQVPINDPKEVLKKTRFCEIDKFDQTMLAECDVTMLGEFLLSILRAQKRKGSVDRAIENEIAYLRTDITRLKSRGEDARLSELKLRALEKVNLGPRVGKKRLS